MWLADALPKGPTGKMLKREIVIPADVRPSDGGRGHDRRAGRSGRPPTARRDVAAALDMLLAEAALGPGRRFFPDRSALRFARALAGRPDLVAARAESLAGELTRVAGGVSAVAPAAKDRRFADPAWTGNPLLRRVMQAYLATGRRGARPRRRRGRSTGATRERMRFAVANLVEALAPSNNPLLSPEAWKAAIDSGGAQRADRGQATWSATCPAAPRVPTMVPPDAYTVGTDLAVTPGDVVLRTPVFELIQYPPSTETVRELPLLIVPPTINKFYVLDLAPGPQPGRVPGRPGPAGVRDVLAQPGRAARRLGLRRLRAGHPRRGRTRRRASAAPTPCTCSAPAPAASWPAWPPRSRAAPAGRARGAADDGLRLASLTLLVTMLDQARTDAVGALVDESMAEAAIAASARKGYLDGRKLAEVFAWLRPGDLIWNYWVNNYLLGREPARFDILFWNADTTRMTAGLHRDFVRAALANTLASPGGLTVLGTEVDLAQVDRGQLRGRREWPTTSAPGSPATAAPSCSAARPGSCCPPAGTSRRSSTRRTTRSPATRSATTSPPTRTRGSGGARTERARGGRTTPPGWRQRSGAQVPAPAALGGERYPRHRARPGQLRAGRMKADAASGPRSPR